MDQRVLENKVGIVEHVDPEIARNNVLQSARDFKNSWRNLAASLHVVWASKVWKQWGYESFDEYTAKEISIRKHTAMKLIRSYQFLHNEKIEYFKNELSNEQEKTEPGWEEINTLQRAKKQLPESDYKQIKEYILKDQKDVGEVKKDITLLIKQRKDIDPEEEKAKKGKIDITNFLKTLESFKHDIKVLKILPAVIAQDIDALIQKIKTNINTQ